ncbi:ATP-binding protein [Streptomyces anulatus]|uniref:ATP-binding protein n=1 Tax=Streptomyces anulatus TaxID=1892 RepID=UPI001C25D9C4|nr:ATP-binding protein [Streptomyces anulatus]
MNQILPTHRAPKAVHLTRGPGLRAARSSEHPLIGLAAGNQPLRLAPQDGHLLLVAPPGLGTSTVLRALGAQHLAAGGHLDILDTHIVGQAWARRLDRVRYLDEPQAIAVHLHGLAHQARRRAEAGRPGPARLVLVESLTPEVLLDHHLDARPNGTPMDALTALLAHGRQAGTQVVLACRHEIPPPLRHIAADLFTTRLLIEPSADTWLQAGGTAATHPQHEDPHPGRWHHLNAAGSRELRAAHLDEADAAAWNTHFSPAGRTPAPRTTKESDR